MITATNPNTTSLKTPFLSAIMMFALIWAKGLFELSSRTSSSASSYTNFPLSTVMMFSSISWKVCPFTARGRLDLLLTHS